MNVGIVTMFYNSLNYGGILQSYALVKALENQGINAEQISYDYSSAYSIKRRVRDVHSRHIPLIQHPSYVGQYININKRRKLVVKASADLVKHSKNVYSEKTISKSVDDYDAIITGSDQVWHGDWPAFFLNFVPSEKKKISYAASVGKSILSESDIQMISNNTNDFKAISVREKDTAEQLNVQMGNKVEVVLDPTLILDRDEWEQITSERLISRPYVFCYFLGTDLKMRKLAREYAKKNGYEIVTIPFMQQRVFENDLNFSDISIFNATPQDFLSYIKNAEVVFTDSFHGSVFSMIYNKQYFVFGRLEHKEMNNRICTLTEMFDVRNHFIENIEQYNLNYIETTDDIEYNKTYDEYYTMKEKSIEFLKKNLL